MFQPILQNKILLLDVKAKILECLLSRYHSPNRSRNKRWIFDFLWPTEIALLNWLLRLQRMLHDLFLVNFLKDSIFQSTYQKVMKRWSVCNLVSALIKLNHKELFSRSYQMKYTELILIFSSLSLTFLGFSFLAI